MAFWRCGCNHVEGLPNTMIPLSVHSIHNSFLISMCQCYHVKMPNKLELLTARYCICAMSFTFTFSSLQLFCLTHPQFIPCGFVLRYCLPFLSWAPLFTFTITTLEYKYLPNPKFSHLLHFYPTRPTVSLTLSTFQPQFVPQTTRSSQLTTTRSIEQYSLRTRILTPLSVSQFLFCIDSFVRANSCYSFNLPSTQGCQHG